jgi:hypothetical protein
MPVDNGHEETATEYYLTRGYIPQFVELLRALVRHPNRIVLLKRNTPLDCHAVIEHCLSGGAIQAAEQFENAIVNEMANSDREYGHASSVKQLFLRAKLRIEKYESTDTAT